MLLSCTKACIYLLSSGLEIRSTLEESSSPYWRNKFVVRSSSIINTKLKTPAKKSVMPSTKVKTPFWLPWLATLWLVYVPSAEQTLGDLHHMRTWSWELALGCPNHCREVGWIPLCKGFCNWLWCNHAKVWPPPTKPGCAALPELQPRLRGVCLAQAGRLFFFFSLVFFSSL